jgi:hypothetical protein
MTPLYGKGASVGFVYTVNKLGFRRKQAQRYPCPLLSERIRKSALSLCERSAIDPLLYEEEQAGGGLQVVEDGLDWQG